MMNNNIYESPEQYCVQEIIGGWRQNPIYTGSLIGAEEFLSEHDGNYSLVPEMYLEVDYL